MKDFKFDSKTVQSAINKGSQGEWAEGLAGSKKPSRKSKNHAKQASVGESKLFPLGGAGAPA